MKKLFALVLSLALVVAFAVPALASGWAQLEWQIPVYKDITLTLTGLDLSENTAAVGSLYAPLSVYYPVVKNSRVHFYAEVSLPAKGYVSAAMERLLKDWNLELDIEVSNIKLDNDFTRYNKYSNKIEPKDLTVSTFGSVADGELTIPFDYNDIMDVPSSWGFEFWGNVKADGKDAVVNATIGFYNKFKDGVMKIDRDTSMDGIVDFIVSNTQTHPRSGFGAGFIVDACDKEGNSCNQYVFFPTIGTGHNQKVDKDKPVLISFDGKQYTIVKSTVNTLAFMNNGVYASGATYNSLMAVYEKIFGFLGFNYEEADYMTNAHFVHFFGTIKADSKKITYPNGSVIVNPVDPKLPQTGDNASIIGFAMVAVALLAAAVVTVKKVRA